MEYVIIFVFLIGITLLAQILTLRSIRKNENVSIPFTFVKSIGKHWDDFLKPDIKRKYRWQYAGWVLLFLVIGVLAVVIFNL
ncbi:MAG: hypothetical protein WAV05_15580 [Anaerolineales bacterium]